MSRQVKIITDSKWAAIAAKLMKARQIAVVFGNSIHLHQCSREEFLSNKRWLCHELAHVEQYAKHGRYLFLLKYFWEHTRRGYNRNSFEVEARSREYDDSLLQQIKLY